jgi:hypothetical protein
MFRIYIKANFILYKAVSLTDSDKNFMVYEMRTSFAAYV